MEPRCNSPLRRILHPNWKAVGNIGGIYIYDSVVEKIKPIFRIEWKDIRELLQFREDVIKVIREEYPKISESTAKEYAKRYIRFMRMKEEE